MDAKGSITVFFTLLLSLVISLISTLLLSAKITAGRTQIALAMDQAMFSALAKYDRQLFEEYHLLYMDGGYGTDTLQLGKVLDEIETDVSYILTPNKERKGTGGENLLQLEMIEGAITGYTLATDCNGSVFKEQVVSYMENTLGIQGISLLTKKLASQKEILESQEKARETVENKGTLEDYEDIKYEAKQPLAESEEKEEPPPKQISEETKSMAQQAEMTLDTVSVKRNSSILNMVIPKLQPISGWVADKKELLSNRRIQTGMGYLQEGEEIPVYADILFQEYLLQNVNHYQQELHTGGPAYGVEKIIFGKISDPENLESMASGLLLIREAANTASLCMDENRMSNISILAESLAAVLEMPFVKPILEGAIVLAWAYAESLVDVAALFEGSTVPLIKSSDTWQVSFAEIPGALITPGDYYREGSGASYEDYLRIFLTLRSEKEKLEGGMEVIELSMRDIPGKERFSMDCAIDTIETEFQIRSQNYITFFIKRQRSYRNI